MYYAGLEDYKTTMEVAQKNYTMMMRIRKTEGGDKREWNYNYIPAKGKIKRENKK